MLWPQRQSSGSQAYFTSILDANGAVTTPAREVFPAWDAVTKNPALISLGGQRFLSFSGLNDGRSGAQYFATSGDGLTWSVSNGSMSETQSAYAAYGSDAIDNAGTPVWVGNAGSTTGIRWHVGTSDANPAPAGSDQSYTLSGCCAYNAAAARDAATGAVYAAFYSNSSATSENGIQVGQILPGVLPVGGRHPTRRPSGTAAPTRPTPARRSPWWADPVAACTSPTPWATRRPKFIRVLNVVTGATLDVPGSADADAVALSAEPDGRLWITWEQERQGQGVHTNAAATRSRLDRQLGRTSRHREPVEVHDRRYVRRRRGRLHRDHAERDQRVAHQRHAHPHGEGEPRLCAPRIRRDVHGHRCRRSRRRCDGAVRQPHRDDERRPAGRRSTRPGPPAG